MSVASEINRIKANIADAYTEAEAKGATMPATENSANLADTVASIPQGSAPTLQSKTVNPTTSQQSVTPDSGYDGLLDVTVNATPLETKTVTPTNQQQVVTPTAPNIGLSSVTVGAAPQPTLITKQITENGTYTAEDDGADGFSEVTVDVDINQTLDAYIQGDLTNIVTNATKIAPSIFRNTSIVSVSMPNATEIERQAFFYCAYLVSVNLSNNLIAIKESAFQGDNNLELSELPDSLLRIESSAFNGCSKLAITKLPKNLTSIFANSFAFCTGIPYLDVSELAQIPTLSNSSAFINTTFPFYFSDQTQLDSWAAASNWAALASRFQIKPSEV